MEINEERVKEMFRLEVQVLEQLGRDWLQDGGSDRRNVPLESVIFHIAWLFKSHSSSECSLRSVMILFKMHRPAQLVFLVAVEYVSL